MPDTTETTELIVDWKTQGANEARQAADQISQAHDKASAAAEKATIGQERALAALQRRIDPAARAQQDLARAQMQLNRFMEKGIIDQSTYNGLMAQASARYAVGIPVAHGFGVAIGGISRQAELGITQSMSLQHAIRGTTEMMAQGVNPARALAMEVNNISYALSGIGGWRQAGSVLLRFLISPVNLAIIGFGILAGVASHFFASTESGGKKAETALQRQKTLIEEIKKSWESAGKAQTDYYARSTAEQLKDTHNQLIDAQKAFAKDMAAFLDPLQLGLGHAQEAQQQGTEGPFGPYTDALKRFAAAAKAGKPDFDALVTELSKIEDKQAAGARGRPRELGESLLESAKAAREDQRRIAQLQDAIKGLNGDTEAQTRLTGKSADAMHSAAAAADLYAKSLEKLQQLSPEATNPRSQAQDALTIALGNAGGDLPLRQKAYREYEDFLRRINSEEQKAANIRLGDLQFKQSAVGMDPYARGLAEISHQYQVQIDKAKDARAGHDGARA